MKSYKELEEQWELCRGEGQILVDAKHPLRMFLNINDSGNKELLVPVTRFNTTFKSTAAIGVRNYEIPGNKYFAVELLQADLTSEYLSLCFDLIESSRLYTNASEARKALFLAFKKWYYLLSEVRDDILPDNEIQGLLGELRYILKEVRLGKEDLCVLNAWQVFKDASRDFIYDNTWSEIKTIVATKDYVTISSIEQLDHEIDGKLFVYRIEKKNDLDSISLNEMVNLVRDSIGFEAETILNQKLLSKGYSYNEQYEKYRYTFVGESVYTVSEDFPRITRTMLSPEIWRAKYDLRLNMIERWRDNE